MAPNPKRYLYDRAILKMRTEISIILPVREDAESIRAVDLLQVKE